jgi:hypothetical protein
MLSLILLAIQSYILQPGEIPQSLQNSFQDSDYLSLQNTLQDSLCLSLQESL